MAGSNEASDVAFLVGEDNFVFNNLLKYVEMSHKYYIISTGKNFGEMTRIKNRLAIEDVVILNMK